MWTFCRDDPSYLFMLNKLYVPMSKFQFTGIYIQHLFYPRLFTQLTMPLSCIQRRPGILETHYRLKHADKHNKSPLLALAKYRTDWLWRRSCREHCSNVIIHINHTTIVINICKWSLTSQSNTSLFDKDMANAHEWSWKEQRRHSRWT